MVNQISSVADGNDHGNGTCGNFLQHLNNAQCKQLINLLSNHFSTIVRANDSSDVPCTSYAIGICFSVSMNQDFSSPQFWIVDSGASRHICSNAHAFAIMRPIQHSSVTILNQTSIPIHYSGDIKLSLDLTLKDVLFVP